MCVSIFLVKCYPCIMFILITVRILVRLISFSIITFAQNKWIWIWINTCHSCRLKKQFCFFLLFLSSLTNCVPLNLYKRYTTNVKLMTSELINFPMRHGFLLQALLHSTQIHLNWCSRNLMLEHYLARNAESPNDVIK